MTILWSFSYNSFVKFDGMKIFGQQHACVISDSVIMGCVIKELYCGYK